MNNNKEYICHWCNVKNNNDRTPKGWNKIVLSERNDNYIHLCDVCNVTYNEYKSHCEKVLLGPIHTIKENRND